MISASYEPVSESTWSKVELFRPSKLAGAAVPLGFPRRDALPGLACCSESRTLHSNRSTRLQHPKRPKTDETSPNQHASARGRVQHVEQSRRAAVDLTSAADGQMSGESELQQIGRRSTGSEVSERGLPSRLIDLQTAHRRGDLTMSTRPTTPSAKRTSVYSTTSSRAGSPTKPQSSLNPSLPRQPSHPLLASQRSTGALSATGSPSRPSSGSAGRLSPTKRATTASNNTLRAVASNASLASQRSGTGAAGGRVRPERHSSDDPSTDDFPDDESAEDGDEDELSEREVPVRKAGFGPSSPRKLQAASGKHGSDDNEEEVPDGKVVNVVVCLRFVASLDLSRASGS